VILEGRTVSTESVLRRQIQIEDGIITALGPSLGKADHVFDDSYLIFPGFGDVHVHLREGQEYKEDYQTGARAALAGGVTFCLDMPNNPISPVDAETLSRKRNKVGNPPIHIGLYAALGPGTKPFGHNHYKAFLAHSIGPLYFEDLAAARPALEPYRGCQVTFHCEDPQMLKPDESNHEASRPAEAEVEAIKFALQLADEFDIQVNIAHVSTADGLRAILAHGGATSEVTPHHLFFDVKNREQFERASWIKMNPPLRLPSDREFLMDSFLQGKIDFLATDHAPHTTEEKSTTNPSGVPHLDTYGAFCTWLMKEHNCPPQTLCQCAAENPGRFFDGRPRRIALGEPADLTILALDSPWTVKAEDVHSKCGWSPFEGFTFPGRVAQTWVSGRCYQDGLEVAPCSTSA
jgi:dihydroorotase